MANKKEKKITAEYLYQSGSVAQANYDYATAIEMYSQAMQDDSIDPELAYSILNQRAECYDLMGEFIAGKFQ